jgi:hypothetical protein
MRTEDLIADLASRAGPVKPLPAPGIRTIGWSAAAIVCALAGVAVYGSRPGLGALLDQPDFGWTAVLGFATMMTAAASALVLAVPGAERSRLLGGVTIAMVGVWGATMILAVARAGNGLAGVSDWPICFIRVVSIGLLPAVVMVGMLRRAAPLRPGWTAALATAAAVAAGAVAIQFVCPVSDPGHALLGHFIPVVSIAAASAAAGRRILKQHGPRG